MTLEQAVSQAKAALTDADSDRQPVPSPGIDGLTAREREVAVLLARGCSNQRIAETLVIGKRTAEMHVGHLFSKVGVASRAQLAVWAVEHGLLDDEVAPTR